MLRRNPRRAGAPGEKYRYSNIGYWILGRVIEDVTGERFTDFATRRVLAPLGITTDEMAYTVPDPNRHASGYLERYSLINVVKSFVIDPALIGGRAGAWVHIRGHYPNGPAFGGLVGTAAAFGKFLQDQLGGRSALFDDATRALFVQQQRANGALIPMTLGWHIGTRSGEPFLFKEGGGGGFHSMMRVYPSRGIGTVVMTNATTFDVRGLMDSIDGAVR